MKKRKKEEYKRKKDKKKGKKEKRIEKKKYRECIDTLKHTYTQMAKTTNKLTFEYNAMNMLIIKIIVSKVDDSDRSLSKILSSFLRSNRYVK